MKQKILFSILVAASITTFAQTEKKVTGYAITGPQKGQGNWKSVRLIDMTTGEEVKTIYSSDMPEPEILNARTGKPVVKKDVTNPAPDVNATNIRIVVGGKNPGDVSTVYTFNSIDELKASKTFTDLTPAATKATDASASVAKVNDIKMTLDNIKSITINDRQDYHGYRHGIVDDRNHFQIRRVPEQKTDAPFATSSAALAYDKKHDRLYYTPMGINQLRYIDLKSKTPKVYYFEDEAFGTVTGYWDGGNQIARMVIASDGNGYALSNNNEHLIRFTTGKKPEITDLGGLADDVANDNATINSSRGFGGDLVADASENLYLINANCKVFKISIDSKVATYLGVIQGLPRGFSTNGAMVESGSNVIVCSAESTEGYYRVDMNSLHAEKLSKNGAVFNASDLASGNLLFEDKGSKEEIMPVLAYQAKVIPADVSATDGISVYPNPVFDRTVKLSFANQPAGDYKIQLMELSGKVISEKNVAVNSKVQLIQFSLPQLLAKGSYLVKTTSDANKLGVITKLIVE